MRLTVIHIYTLTCSGYGQRAKLGWAAENNNNPSTIISQPHYNVLSCVVKMSGSESKGAVLWLRSRDRATRAVLRCLWACGMLHSAFVEPIYPFLGWKQTDVNCSKGFVSHILSYVLGLVGDCEWKCLKFFSNSHFVHWRHVDIGTENAAWSTYLLKSPKASESFGENSFFHI